jgi:hypothetical protein
MRFVVSGLLMYYVFARDRTSPPRGGSVDRSGFAPGFRARRSWLQLGL